MGNAGTQKGEQQPPTSNEGELREDEVRAEDALADGDPESGLPGDAQGSEGSEGESQ